MKIGLSLGDKKLKDESFLKECDEAGIDCIEVSLNHTLCADYDYGRLKRDTDRYSLGLWSFHLPFFPFEKNDISSTDNEIRKNSIRLHKSLIDKAGEIGIKNFIIHPSAEPVEIPDRRDRLLCSKQSLSELADETDKFGAVLCIEDLPRTCIGRNSYELCELIKDDGRLRICFDTNHLLGEYISDFINKVGSKIATVHISDYDFWNERHWLPGEGDIDWKQLLEDLVKTGYKGPWLYEVGFGAPYGIKRDRDLTAGDFVRNADEILTGKEITVLGKRIENIGF